MYFQKLRGLWFVWHSNRILYHYSQRSNMTLLKPICSNSVCWSCISPLLCFHNQATGAIVSAMFSNNIIATLLSSCLKWLLFNSYLPNNVFLIKLTSPHRVEKIKWRPKTQNTSTAPLLSLTKQVFDSRVLRLFKSLNNYSQLFKCLLLPVNNTATEALPLYFYGRGCLFTNARLRRREARDTVCRV